MSDHNKKPDKMCIVCGMPLVKDEDYPKGADTESCEWCKHCGTKDDMHPYDVAVEGMKNFMMKTQGMEEDQAAKAAKEMIDNCEAVTSGKMKKS